MSSVGGEDRGGGVRGSNEQYDNDKDNDRDGIHVRSKVVNIGVVVEGLGTKGSEQRQRLPGYKDEGKYKVKYKDKDKDKDKYKDNYKYNRPSPPLPPLPNGHRSRVRLDNLEPHLLISMRPHDGHRPKSRDGGPVGREGMLHSPGGGKCRIVFYPTCRG